MDIKHSINPVRRFDLFMRNTRRTGVLRGFQHNTEMSIGINPQSMDMRVINERVRLGEWTTVRNLVRFDHKATDEFPYMYHCHILEHEDRGMMGQFTVS